MIKNTEYTPEMQHRCQQLPFSKGVAFSKPSFWVSMLVFGSVLWFSQSIVCGDRSRDMHNIFAFLELVCVCVCVCVSYILRLNPSKQGSFGFQGTKP